MTCHSATCSKKTEVDFEAQKQNERRAHLEHSQNKTNAKESVAMPFFKIHWRNSAASPEMCYFLFSILSLNCCQKINK